jgi:hypothetical protein
MLFAFHTDFCNISAMFDRHPKGGKQLFSREPTCVHVKPFHLQKAASRGTDVYSNQSMLGFCSPSFRSRAS